jgi:hypothetical protein
MKKLGIVAASFTVMEALNHGVDFIVYPLMIGFLGPLKGGVIMTTFWLVTNYLLIAWYHKTKQDWFGFEWLALKKEEEATTLSGKILRGALRIGHWPAFLFLCWEDPFKAFIFVRGRKASGFRFSKGDWGWFFAVNIIGNLIWILIISGAIEFIKRLFLS